MYQPDPQWRGCHGLHFILARGSHAFAGRFAVGLATTKTPRHAAASHNQLPGVATRSGEVYVIDSPKSQRTAASTSASTLHTGLRLRCARLR